MTRYLVTGGAGFIGSHLVEALVARGERVRVLDDLSTGKRENLSTILGDVELLVGDVADPRAVDRAMDGCEIAVHLAAVASVQPSLANPLHTNRVNVGGTLNVLDAARRASVDRVVFASSCAFYGHHAAFPLGEDLPPQPLSPYAAAKAAGEMYCAAFHASYGLPTVSLRFFNIYGPRQDPTNPYSGVISIFTSRLHQGKAPVIYGDGEQTRDFVYVEDLVRALLLACEREAAVGEVFNVASGTQTSILQLVAILNQVLGTDLSPRFEPARPGEVRYSEGNARRARNVLGWEATIPIHEGLSRMIRTEE